MTTATPLPPPQSADLPPPPGTPVEREKTGHGLLWLVLGGLALLLAIGVGTFFFLSGGEEESAVVNDHTAETGEPALISVPGYTYGNPATAVASDFDTTMQQTNGQLAAMMPAGSEDVYVSWSMHEMSATGTDPLGMLGLLEVNQEFAATPQFDPDMVVAGIAGGMATDGATVSTETIEGENVAVAEGDVTAYAWYHDGTVSMAFGENQSDLLQFVEAYLAEANS